MKDNVVLRLLNDIYAMLDIADFLLSWPLNPCLVHSYGTELSFFSQTLNGARLKSHVHAFLI